jgi:LCP family protein required for cell wall assembly
VSPADQPTTIQPPVVPGAPPPGASRAESSGRMPMPSRAARPRPGEPAPPVAPVQAPSGLESRLSPPADKPPLPEAPVRQPRTGPERREDVDPASLTAEMEPIGDEVKKRREVDHTLARFSAVHDELAQQERQRKERRQKLMPWKNEHDPDEPEATQFSESVPDDDNDDEDGQPRERGRTAQQTKIIAAVKLTSLSLAVIVFLATGVAWGATVWFDSKIVEIDALNENSAAVLEADKQLGDENFLIVGSDTRAGAKPEDGVGDVTQEQGARSDVMMIAHIPADRKRVVIVSIPRDVQVTRPECQEWDPQTGAPTGQTLPAEEGVHANEAYAVGGPKCVSEMVTGLTGLKINHFVSVDFNGFKDMVNAVGSIKVCVPGRMDDEELGLLFDKGGEYEISDDLALRYVRARKVKGELKTDYERIDRQKQFMSSLLRQVLSSETLLSPTKLNAFINAFTGATVGQNISVSDLLTLGQSLQGLEPGRVSFVTIPSHTDEGPTLENDDNIEVLEEEKTAALFTAIRNGTPLPGETPDAAGTEAPQGADPAAVGKGSVVDPKSVSVQVFNGDDEFGGIAAGVAEQLRNLGFTVVNIDDVPNTDRTVIRYAAGGENWAETLKAAVPSAELEVDPSMGGAVALVLGSGFDGTVVAPRSAAGGQGQTQQTTTPEDLSILNAGEQNACA